MPEPPSADGSAPSPPGSAIVVPRPWAATSGALPILLAVLLIVYGRTLRFPLDKFDEPQLAAASLALVESHSSVFDVLSRDAFLSSEGLAFFRPLQNLSFWLDRQLYRSWTAGLRCSNLALHLAAGLTLYSLLLRLGFERTPALIATIVFSVDPVLVHAVVWIPARGDLLCTLFCLCSFHAFTASRDGSRPLFLLSLLAYTAALFSKETAALLPIVMLTYLFLTGRASGWRGWLAYIPHVAIGAGYAFTRSLVINERLSVDDFGVLALCSNFFQLPEYLAKILLPLRLSPMPCYSTLVTAVGFTAMTLVALSVYLNPDRRDRALCGLGMAWYLALLLPSMAFRSHDAEVGYRYLEHRAHGLAIGIVLIALTIAHRYRLDRSRLGAIMGIALTIVYGAFSFRRTSDYTDAEAFYSAALRFNPGSALAFRSRGRARMESGNRIGAIDDFRKSARIKPDSFETYYSRAEAEADIRDYPAAIDDYTRVIRFVPNFAEAYFRRGVARQDSGDSLGALADYSHAIEHRPDHASAYYNRGVVYSGFGQLQEAVEQFTRALRIDSSDPNPWNARGAAMFGLKRYRDAIADYDHALAAGPSKADVLFNRALAYAALGDRVAACRDLATSARASPGSQAQNAFDGFCRTAKPGHP